MSKALLVAFYVVLTASVAFCLWLPSNWLNVGVAWSAGMLAMVLWAKLCELDAGMDMEISTL